MSDDFLSRWSRRKHAARRGDPAPEPAPQVPASSLAAQPSDPETRREETGVAPAEAALPPIESLTPDSDFTPFMRSGVDPALRRQALKTLLRDPRFNVMDGLDVYIDDYSKPDPIPPEWLEKLTQTARLGDFPAREAAERAAAEARRAEEGGAITPAEQGISSAAATPPSDTSGTDEPPPQSTQS